MDVAPGRLLDDRYRLGPLVGCGGMATVHSATDLRLRRAVAVKLFHAPVDEIALARLTAEARMLAGLSHPGLVKVFDVCMESEQPYLVMQLVSGFTLRTVINRGPLEPLVVARLGARLAETLRYVHSRHVVHRDLKPSNVLLDRNGLCYLADFGIAKAEGAAHLTASGHCIGTAAYLAPEQVSGIDAGPPADIYTLGLVLLESLTGQPEFTGTEAEAAIARLNRSPHVPRYVPPALRRILIGMTARQPADRPTAAACAALFEKYLDNPAADSGELPTVVTKPVDPPTKSLEDPARTKRMRPVRAAGALAALAVVIMGVLLPADPPPARPADQPPANPTMAPVMVAPETATGQVVVPEQQPPAQRHVGGGEDNSGKKKPTKSSKGHG
jgi:serine/threonine protein kinase